MSFASEYEGGGMLPTPFAIPEPDGSCLKCGLYPEDQPDACLVCEPDKFGQVTDFKGTRSVKQDPDFGYHKHKINKGVLGEASKITEEYCEFLDAVEQKNSVMELVELSDLLGAIEAYTKKKYLIDIGTLLTMTRATQRAFKLGQRK